MKREVKEKWVAALRSGEYQQTQGVLREIEDGKPVGYCCLGVLCDIAVKDGVEGLNDTGSTYEVHPLIDEDISNDVDTDRWVLWEDENLPDVVQKWAALPEFEQLLGPDKIHLAIYNDGREEIPGGDEPKVRPHSFAEIADLIEEHL